MVRFTKAAKAMGFRKPVGSKLKSAVKKIVRQIVPKPEKSFITFLTPMDLLILTVSSII